MSRAAFGSRVAALVALAGCQQPPPPIQPCAPRSEASSVPADDLAEPTAPPPLGPAYPPDAVLPTVVTPRTLAAIEPVELARLPPASPACRELARVVCEGEQRCAPGRHAATEGPASACETTWSGRCAMWMAAADSGYDEATVRACASALRGRVCGRWRRFEDFPVQACHPVGKRQHGAACRFGAQCRGGHCAPLVLTSEESGLSAGTCGVCRPRVGDGERMGNMEQGRNAYGCPLGALPSRNICFQLADEGEPCGAGAWTDNCYGSAPHFPERDTVFTCDLSASPPRCRDTGERIEPLFATDGGAACGPDRRCPRSMRCESGQCVPGRGCADGCPGLAQCVDGRCIVVDPATCSAELW